MWVLWILPGVLMFVRQHFLLMDPSPQLHSRSSWALQWFPRKRHRPPLGSSQLGKVMSQTVVENRDPVMAGDGTLGCRRVPVTAFVALGMGREGWK